MWTTLKVPDAIWLRWTLHRVKQCLYLYAICHRLCLYLFGFPLDSVRFLIIVAVDKVYQYLPSLDSADKDGEFVDTIFIESQSGECVNSDKDDGKKDGIGHLGNGFRFSKSPIVIQFNFNIFFACFKFYFHYLFF